jgi:hypothetical protein
MEMAFDTPPSLVEMQPPLKKSKSQTKWAKALVAEAIDPSMWVVPYDDLREWFPQFENIDNQKKAFIHMIQSVAQNSEHEGAMKLSPGSGDIAFQLKTHNGENIRPFKRTVLKMIAHERGDNGLPWQGKPKAKKTKEKIHAKLSEITAGPLAQEIDASENAHAVEEWIDPPIDEAPFEDEDEVAF